MKIDTVEEEESTMSNLLQDKLTLVDSKSALFLDALPEETKAKVKLLQEIQVQRDSLYNNFIEERSALEKKYEKLYEPLYHQRYELVNGEKEEGEAKGIPDFWLTVLKHNIVTQEQMTERDEEALKYLKNIVCHSLGDAKGFKLEFFFAPNPFFSNEVLSKTYFMIDEDEPILEKAEGTTINWLSGKDLTKKVMKKKAKKGSKNQKPQMKTVDCESFFNFFSPPQVPGEDEQLNEDEAEDLQESMESDYDIGSTIREKIIPQAVYWFTGEAMEAEDYEEGDFDEDDEDGEEGDDEDNDEDDDDEDEDADNDDQTPVKKSSKKKGGKGGTAENPAECKQQ